MPRPDSLQGALDLLILKVLSRRAPLHGYALVSAIVESSGDVLRVEEGSLYPALHRLEEEGWIKGRWIVKESGRRSRVYDLTSAGRGRLPAEQQRWVEISAAIHQVLRMA
jgi:PadR family transcriptional regulator, regulatory protein PadR